MNRREHVGTVVIALAATLTAKLSLPAIAIVTLGNIGGNLAADAVRPYAAKLGERLGIRALFGDELLRQALYQSLEKALKRLEDSYRSSPKYKASPDQDFIDATFDSLRSDAQQLFQRAASAELAGRGGRFPVDVEMGASISLSASLQQYLPNADEHLRNYIEGNLPALWSGAFLERLSTDEPTWRALELLERSELHATLADLPTELSEAVRVELEKAGPSPQWEVHSRKALNDVIDALESQIRARLGEVLVDVHLEEAVSRQHTTDEADRVIRALMEMVGELSALISENLKAPNRKQVESEEDVTRLRNYSDRIFRNAQRNSRIDAEVLKCHIDRPVVSLLCKEAGIGGLLVTGEPGAGKSGVMYEAASKLQEDGIPLIYLDASTYVADNLAITSRGVLPGRPIADVLLDWDGVERGVVFIDGLDAVRDEVGMAMLRQVLSTIVTSAPRWSVVASIRRFDLRYSVDLPRFFPGAPVGPLDASLPQLRYLQVTALSDEELGQAMSSSAMLSSLLSTGDAVLRDLLRIPFNLRLAADLLASGVSMDLLVPLRTQAELLDQYWRHRIIREDGGRDNREIVLERAVEGMIVARGLRVERRTLRANDTSAGEPIRTLLREGVLTEWQATPESRPDEQTLAFSHHVLFDYAAGRLAFGSGDRSLLSRIAREPDLAIFLRPSIVFYLHELWNSSSGREKFWRVVIELAESADVPGLARIIGPTAVFDLYSSLSDAEYPLALLDSAAERR